MIDRSSKRLSATLYKGKSSTSFLEATIQNISKQYSELKTLTSDNGSENARLSEITENWYCTDAYSSWEKGSIEQKHKQFRKFFPKGVSFKNLTQEKLDQIVLIINCETYYQNGVRTKLNKTIFEYELEMFKNLINSNKSFIFK